MATRREPAARACRLSKAPVTQVVELLGEERRAWRRELHWDPGELGEALELAASARLLPGAAVLCSGRVVAYLSGHSSAGCFRPSSVHLRREAPPGAAELLVEATLALPEARGRPLEAQLTAFAAQDSLDAAFARRGVEVVRRSWLVLQLESPPRAADPRLVAWSSERLPSSAAVLQAAHAGGVEARINAAFREQGAARDYLRDVVRGPGCGHFLPRASFLALQGETVVGLCLATTVSPGTAHVPQVVVHPGLQGTGLGSALLASTCRALAAEGFFRLTLSVSEGNRRAYGWYRRLGFSELARFSAYHRPGPGPEAR